MKDSSLTLLPLEECSHRSRLPSCSSMLPCLLLRKELLLRLCQLWKLAHQRGVAMHSSLRLGLLLLLRLLLSLPLEVLEQQLLLLQQKVLLLRLHGCLVLLLLLMRLQDCLVLLLLLMDATVVVNPRVLS